MTERFRLDESIDIKYYSVDKNKMTLILELLTVKGDFEDDVLHALVAYNQLETKINTLSFIIFGNGNPINKSWPLIDMSLKEPDVHLHPSDNTELGSALERVYTCDNFYELEHSVLSYHKTICSNKIIKVVSKVHLDKSEFSMKFLGR